MIRRLLFIAACALLAGCAHKPKPVHVPLVAYTAHFSDKDCKPIAGTPMFRCNNVVLDPKEINVNDHK